MCVCERAWNLTSDSGQVSSIFLDITLASFLFCSYNFVVVVANRERGTFAIGFGPAKLMKTCTGTSHLSAALPKSFHRLTATVLNDHVLRQTVADRVTVMIRGILEDPLVKLHLPHTTEKEKAKARKTTVVSFMYSMQSSLYANAFIAVARLCPYALVALMPPCQYLKHGEQHNELQFGTSNNVALRY